MLLLSPDLDPEFCRGIICPDREMQRRLIGLNYPIPTINSDIATRTLTIPDLDTKFSKEFRDILENV
jgi:hypothetical protein